MEAYTKTNWVNDETYLNEDNMNKIENQLETLTNYDIENDTKPCMGITSDDITNWNNKAETKYIDDSVQNIYIIGDIYDDSITDTLLEISKKGINNIPCIIIWNYRAYYIETVNHNDDGITHYLTFVSNFENSGETQDYGVDYRKIQNYTVTLTYNSSEETVSVTEVDTRYQFYTFSNNNNLLGMNNTDSYTPTSDYNPATKKYVDDAISSAIGTTLEGSY